MTIETLFVFAILLTALVLFFTGWVRMDIVALMVLGVLAVTGLVTPAQALSGFSNPAVITVWSMFILSAAFSYTGIARSIGRFMFHFSGKSEWRVILVIMSISALMSSVMNNIGVAALMLPVVMDIARSTGRSPARLLLPLAIATHLGGLTTLIGNPANLVVSVELEQAGYHKLELFDFIPLGGSVMILGILFVSLWGRHFLIRGAGSMTLKSNTMSQKKFAETYHLNDRTFFMTVDEHSSLEGRTLSESRLRPSLGINVLSVKRKNGGTILNPGPDTMLRADDRLFVQGRYDVVKAIKTWKIFLPGESNHGLWDIDYDTLGFFEVTADPDSALMGKVKNVPARNFKLLAIRQNGQKLLHDISNEEISPNDILLVQSDEKQLDDLYQRGIIESYTPVGFEKLRYVYRLQETIFMIHMPEICECFDNASEDKLLGKAFSLKVLAIKREEGFETPEHGERFMEGDHILVKGNIDDLPLLKGMINIALSDEDVPVVTSLEREDLVMAEAVLAPRSALAGKTLMDINFRKKYGLTVLALWREGNTFRTNIHNMPLRFGEAMLIYGKRDKIAMLGSEPDFILLTDTIPKPFRTKKQIAALLVMFAVLMPVMLGFLPIEITSVIGVALMVLTGCLTMEEAYQSIEWRSVFLIAGMLPLGIAMQQSGAAGVLASGIEHVFGQWGPWGIVAGIYLLSMFLTLALHPAALVVIISPLVLQAAQNYNLSPHSLMIMITIASSSLLSPVSHPANLLVMGPGGYKFVDYIKFGLPLAIVIMVIVFFLLPVFWPL
jgi:di/tricarboxylate transporter